jgi:hyperosmotically inducible protein
MRKLAGLLSITLALGCASAFAQDRSSESASKQSGATQSKSAGDSGKADDRKLLAAVRKAVVGDKSLSRSAHNVKMTANGGVVTLRGSVPSEDEKKKIEQLAQGVSGVSNVENNLDVKAQTTSKKGSSDSTARSGSESSSKDTKTN